MYRSPRRTLANCNNVVSVSLPLTEIDLTVIADRVVETIGLKSLEDLGNVDTETYGVETGSILVYNSEIQKWQSTTRLIYQQIDAGEY